MKTRPEKKARESWKTRENETAKQSNCGRVNSDELMKFSPRHELTSPDETQVTTSQDQTQISRTQRRGPTAACSTWQPETNSTDLLNIVASSLLLGMISIKHNMIKMIH